jgi:hypothetical protein
MYKSFCSERSEDKRLELELLGSLVSLVAGAGGIDFLLPLAVDLEGSMKLSVLLYLKKQNIF